MFAKGCLTNLLNHLLKTFGRKDTGSSITINVKNVERIYGELTNFVVDGKKFNIRFTIDNVTVTYTL